MSSIMQNWDRSSTTGVKINIMHTEKVINEVRTRPCLWNPRNEKYKCKGMKQRAWKEVCEAVAPIFNSLTEEDQISIARAVQSRWKTARDAYMKCRLTPQRKPTYKGKNKYLFYDDLTFLEQVKDGSEADESSNKGNDMEEDCDEDTNESTANNKSNDPLTLNMQYEMCESTPSIAPEFDSGIIKVEDNELRPPSRNESTVSDNLGGEEKSNEDWDTGDHNGMGSTSSMTFADSSLQKDDEDFFRSLAPFINGFDAYRKLKLRARILELIQEIGQIKPEAEQTQAGFFK